MKEILVQQIIGGFLTTGDKNDIGRYREIALMSGQVVRPGTIATFFDRKGEKVKGTLVNGCTIARGVVMVDTFL